MNQTPDFKTILIIILTAIVAIAGAYGIAVHFDIGSPAPVSTPTPVVSAVPTPTPTAVVPNVVSFAGLEKPTPGVVPVLSNLLTVGLSANETTSRFLYAVSAVTPSVVTPVGIHVALFSMPIVTTTQATIKGARVGDYYDPLVPLAGSVSGPFLVDISVDKGTTPGIYLVEIGDLPVTVNVWSVSIPDRPSVPLYIEFDYNKMMIAHGIPNTAQTTAIAPLLLQYQAMLRAHRIEPMKTMIANPALKADGSTNLDDWGGGALSGSFRTVVMNNAVSPICVRSPQGIGFAWATAAQLAGWEKSIAAEPALAGAWAYITDEPTDFAGTAARAQLIKTNAPHLKVMVTTEPRPELLGLVDLFCPIFEFFKQPGHVTDYSKAPGYWTYDSCMSHGNCASAGGTPTGTPDIVIDEPAVHSRALVPVSYVLGSAASLYYNSNENWKSGVDLWAPNGLFTLGGNGDGTLVYPGISGSHGVTTTGPLSSIRLKQLRQGSYDVEYLKLATAAQKAALVPNQFTWSRNMADWETMRAAVSK